GPQRAESGSASPSRLRRITGSVQLRDRPKTRARDVGVRHEALVGDLEELHAVDEARADRNALLPRRGFRRGARVPAALDEAVEVRVGLEQDHDAVTLGAYT